MKKVVWIITAGVTLVGGLFLLLVATAPAQATHTAQIQVELREAGGTPERKVAEYEQIVTWLDAWAVRVGFEHVPPEQTGSMRQHWVGAPGTTRERVTYFRETKPQDPSWPMEMIVTFHPDLAPVVNLSLTEGYHRGPSRKLQTLHFGLQEMLREGHGSKIISTKVW